jgi:predicted PurR-regulated permease PerM
VLGIEYALVLALLAAVMELIPIFGPTLSAIPAIALGFVESPSLGLFVLALYIIIQQFENHLIYPLVVRKVVGVPPIIVILALVIGGQLAGFMGILLSVPVAAVLLEFAEDMQKEKRLRAAK